MAVIASPSSARWPFLDPRMDRSRVLAICYLVARLGVFAVADGYRLFWDNYTTARLYFPRLVELGLLETFTRQSEAEPFLYRVSGRCLEWLSEEIGSSAADELWRPAGIRRMNVRAHRAIARFWCSLAVACRDSERGARLLLMRPERELRRSRGGVEIVPDGLALLGLRQHDAAEDDGRAMGVVGWMLEQDSGSERLHVIAEKACAYAKHYGGPLYGATSWQVLYLVPSRRRAANIARVAVEHSAGHFTYLALAEAMEDGRALEPSLWSAGELAAQRDAAACRSLLTPFDYGRLPLLPSATSIRPDAGSGTLTPGGAPC